MGDIGEPGRKGRPGTKGELGDEGQKGEMGTPGLIGRTGKPVRMSNLHLVQCITALYHPTGSVRRQGRYGHEGYSRKDRISWKDGMQVFLRLVHTCGGV